MDSDDRIIDGAPVALDLNDLTRAREIPLSDIPGMVEAELASFFGHNGAQIRTIGEPVSEALDHLERFVLGGGKRIRPIYGWVGFTGISKRTCEEEHPAAALTAISSLEFIQACALIHDDIIDASDTRRNNPTVHKALAAGHRERGWQGSPDEYGEHAAILVGDLALVWADDMWNHSGLSHGALNRAAEPWRGMRAEVIAGQILDIALESSGNESEELANAVNRYKTAAYTIERPLHLGAALAGATEETVNALRGYGHDVGIAFQLRDDLLGVFGDPAVTGKPAGDDLREGKRTVLYSLALQAADEDNPTAAAQLRERIGTPLEPAEIDELKDLIIATGAVDAVEQRISRLARSGLDHLANADLVPQAVEALETLAVKSTSRRM